MTERKTDFPLDHISQSALIKFSSNPVLFKVFYLNRDRIDSPTNISAIVGGAFHRAMEVFYVDGDVARGLVEGTEYIDLYNENFIRFSTTIPTKQDAIDRFVFGYNAYMNEMGAPVGRVVTCEDEILEMVDVEWRGTKWAFPAPLKGYLDRVDDVDGDLVIIDYKTCSAFSDPEKIDGAKILQAVEYFFLVFAKYGRAPKKLRYEEVKLSKNRDGSPQVKTYEIVFEDNPLYFEFYLRYFSDFVRAMNGEMVYVPNVHSLYDNDLAIIAYIQHLDNTDVVARRIKEEKVTNITELLRKDIANASNMKKLLKYAERAIAETKTINYESMQIHEKIQTKMLEHGMVIKFDSVVEGCSVDLYQFTPSIGLKMSRLKGYTADIEQVAGVSGVRILAPIPNSTLIGVEIPREARTYPEIPNTEGFDIAIGKNAYGDDVRMDIRKAPHVLVAGSTGSGKSVFLTALINQLHKNPRVELVLLDPKRIEFSDHKDKGEYYNTFETIHAKIVKLCEVMESRYKALESAKVKNIENTNLPYIFVLLDEFGEVAVQSKKNKDLDTMTYVLRLAQLARAAGIHLILATQRPSVDIISGTIKTNLPTKVCFKVSKEIDSRVVLDEGGAEKLLGNGDMLFQSDAGLQRLQGYKN